MSDVQLSTVEEHDLLKAIDEYMNVRHMRDRTTNNVNIVEFKGRTALFEHIKALIDTKIEAALDEYADSLDMHESL